MSETPKLLYTSIYDDHIDPIRKAYLSCHDLGLDNFTSFQIMSAFDVLSDTDEALGCFFDEALGKADYLKIYGFFSAIYLQHEAIDTLYKFIVDTKVKSICSDKAKDNVEFREIRNLRNGLSAHSSKANYGKTAYFIHRNLTQADTISFYQYEKQAHENYQGLGKVKSKTYQEIIRVHSNTVPGILKEIESRLTQQGLACLTA